MLKKFLALALACGLVCVASGTRAFAATQADRDAETVANVKAQIARAGTGEAARVTVWLKDGTARKGYVSEKREADFMLRDPKTDAPTTIAYADAARVEINRGHSTFRKYAIGTGVTLGLIFTIALLEVAIGGD